MMSKKFIVIVDDNFSVTERDKITKYFKNKYGYWHWISNVWLLSTSKENTTTDTIRDEVKKLVNKGTIVVINASGSNGWSAFGQKKKFEWMHSNWTKKPESFPETGNIE
ncbi:hypothetical protein ACVND7_12210 [Avibacterium paragallinarum]